MEVKKKKKIFIFKKLFFFIIQLNLFFVLKIKGSKSDLQVYLADIFQ
jgi:hypothetical protein